MWTMAKIRAGAQWLSNHYTANDYYCEGEKIVGEWVGKGAEYLGISGKEIESQSKEFLAIFSGKTPTGEKLRQRASDIMGYDFQCSAQKSVSIVAIIGGDNRLYGAHRSAVKEAYAELEKLACMQSRDNDGNKLRITTGVLCAARFEHDASRALDPQIHTHFAIANFTVGPNGKRYGLETFEMLQAIRYAGKVYQSVLRRNVEALGYQTRDKINQKGLIEGFEIEGVSDEICELYSQRREEIDRAIEAFELKNGRQPTSEEIHVIAKETRTSKLYEISTPEVREKQRSRATVEQLEQIERVKAAALTRGKIRHQERVDAGELVAFLRDHLTERKATFREHDLMAEVLNRGMGRVTVEEVKTSIQNDPELMRLDHVENVMTVFTDRTNYRQEKESVEFVNATRDTHEAINASYVPFPDLIQDGEKWVRVSANGKREDYTEQRVAMEGFFRSRDQVLALRGIAGAGKTTAIAEFHRGVIISGYKHVLVAPTTEQVRGLKREVKNADVFTVESFLLQVKMGSIDLNHAVITCDEWGQLSNRSGHALLMIAKKYDVPIRFVGDVRQHGSVEAGDFARTLENHSNLRSVFVTKIHRQRDEQYRSAVRLLADGKMANGLEILEGKGWIHEEKNSYLAKATEHYLELTESGKKLVNHRGEPYVIAVAPTHAEIGAFTIGVRAQLQTVGTLTGPVSERKAFVAQDSTIAQRRLSTSYRPGTAVTLVSEKVKIRGLSPREVYTVKDSPKKDFVTLIDQRGKEILINVKTHGKKLDLGDLDKIEVRVGDRIWFRANSKGVNNGTISTLVGTNVDGQLVMDNGFVVPNDYLRLAYGYATTSHSSQGRTGEYGIVFGSSFDQKAIYVSHSRARERTDTYIPSREAFLSRAERASGERLGVIEAQKQAREVAIAMAKISREYPQDLQQQSEESVKKEVMADNDMFPEAPVAPAKPVRVYFEVPYPERDEAQELGATYDWRKKQFWILNTAGKTHFQRWLEPEPPRTHSKPQMVEPIIDPRDEFADVLRQLGARLTDDHPMMDGKKHRIKAVDDKQGERSIEYRAYSDGRPNGYGKNYRTGEESKWKAERWGQPIGQSRSVAANNEQEDFAAKQEVKAKAEHAQYRRAAGILAHDLQSYEAVPSAHEYLVGKGIGPQSDTYLTPTGAIAVPAYGIDGRLSTVQYITPSGEKGFAKDAQKTGAFHVVGAKDGEDGVILLGQADAIVIAEGYATAATLQQVHAQDGEEQKNVQFVVAFDSGNLATVAQSIRERFPDKAMVIAGDNDLKQMIDPNPDRRKNPGVNKAREAANAGDGQIWVPSMSALVSDGKIVGSDWNDVALRGEYINLDLRTAIATAQMEILSKLNPPTDPTKFYEQHEFQSNFQDIQDHICAESLNFELVKKMISSESVNQADKDSESQNTQELVEPTDDEALLDDQPIAEQQVRHEDIASQSVEQESREAEQLPLFELSSGVSLTKEQSHENPNLLPLPNAEERSNAVTAADGWISSLTWRGNVDWRREANGKVCVRETKEKIEIFDQQRDVMELALKKASEKFGNHLKFDGEQIGAVQIVNIVVEKNLQLTFTDENLNKQIEIERAKRVLEKHGVNLQAAQGQPLNQAPSDRRSERVPEPEKPKKEMLLQFDVAPYEFAKDEFGKDNKESPFLRTTDESGKHYLYWGVDLPRALEESGAGIGDIITAKRIGRQPVTVIEWQTQPDGSRKEVEIDVERNAWKIERFERDDQMILDAYDRVVKKLDGDKKAARDGFDEHYPGFVEVRDEVYRTRLRANADKQAQVQAQEQFERLQPVR
jgi:conjugative relaxase-like TrwC/TraI family protein